MLLSGMHVTVATHYCGGKLVQALVSVTGDKASCGMEAQDNSCTSHNQVASDCCKDYLSTFKVDGAFNTSVNTVQYLAQNFSPDLQFPVAVVFNSIFPSIKDNFYSIPPGGLAASSFSRPSIGVFQL